MDASPLARLSPELRNLVWEHVFTNPYAVTLKTDEIQHALTKTCRQIRHETLAMYLAMTNFNAHLDDGPATPLVRWLKTLGPESIPLIKQINIWDMHDRTGVIHGIEATQNLLRAGTAGGRRYQLFFLEPHDMRPGWYMCDVIPALGSMGFDLAQLQILEGLGGMTQFTSDFGIRRLDVGGTNGMVAECMSHWDIGG